MSFCVLSTAALSACAVKRENIGKRRYFNTFTYEFPQKTFSAEIFSEILKFHGTFLKLKRLLHIRQIVQPNRGDLCCLDAMNRHNNINDFVTYCKAVKP